MPGTRSRIPLYYTFGNHMHWVDMQWLWGYGVLPGSVRDMLHLIDETGARGNVNFDAVGYEKMAAECPEALAELRAAVEAGKVEPVGCSYGQPYGLFHGGESNVRQLTYGVRATRRLLGVRPRAFWEEEFYFFPQLPQMLAQCGYTGACLFFQWTWHTPEVPREESPLILWEGIDGTRLATLPRGELNLHQWPEDFDGLLDRAAKQQNSKPANEKGSAGLPRAVVQWLELMPSRDWMCRSEVLLPRLRELMGDERFEVRARTLSGVIGELREAARDQGVESRVPVRRYTMDDVWHGMTLGKNGDRHPRTCRRCENSLLRAEALAALAGLMGRPYPRWDAYPTWELEEAWRELLGAQHHDSHECEGLCGDIAYTSLERAESLARGVVTRTLQRLDLYFDHGKSGMVQNLCGWPRDVVATVREPGGNCYNVLFDRVPPFGYAIEEAASPRVRVLRPPVLEETPELIHFTMGGVAATLRRSDGAVLQLRNIAWPDGVVGEDAPLLHFLAGTENSPPIGPLGPASVSQQHGTVFVALAEHNANGCLSLSLAGTGDAEGISIRLTDSWFRTPSPGLGGALKAVICPAFKKFRLRTDSPFAAHEVSGLGTFKRKYPTGDWMTSPQWFEAVENPFTSHSFVDILSDDPGQEGRGLLVIHRGSQQFFRRADGIASVVTAYDPWDEDQYEQPLGDIWGVELIPHGPMSDSQRRRRAMEDAAFSTRCDAPADLPRRLGGLEVCNAPNVLAHALFRESMKSGEHLPEWAGHRMFRESGGACDHPYVVRLVEWDGEPAEVLLKLPGPVAMAAKTNLLGEVRDEETERRRDGESGQAAGGWGWRDTGWLAVEHPVEPPEWAKGAMLKGMPITWSAVRVPMRAREIATVYADLVMGRKEWRDLDAKREVWATVHKRPG